MTMVDERVLREFMMKYYPKYAENLALARILYAKHMGLMAGSLPLVEASGARDYVGMTVCVRGVLAGVTGQRYNACPVCLLSVRKCRCTNKSPETLERSVYELSIGDNTGVIRVVFWSAESMFLKDADVGKEVEVVGVVVEDDDGEFYLKGRSVRLLEKTKNESVDEVLSVIREMQKVKKPVLEGLLKRYGVSFEDVQKYVVQDGEYWVWRA